MKLKEQELAGRLKKGETPCVVLLFGAEQGRIARQAQALSLWALGGDADADFDAESFQAGELKDDDAISRFSSSLRALPFLAPRRLVRLKEAHTLPAAAREELKLYLKDPADSTLLLITAGELEAKNAVRKTVEGMDAGWAAPFYPLEGAAFTQWIEQTLRASGFAPERDALELLTELLTGDTRAAEPELEKLKNYVGEPGPVLVSDVAAVVSNASLHSGFELVAQLVAGNAPAALNTMARLWEHDAEPIPLLGLIAARIRRIAIAQTLLAEGAQPKSIAGKLRIFWKEQDAFFAQCRQLSPRLLAAALEQCLEADKGLKGMDGRPPEQVMESLVMALASLFGARGRPQSGSGSSRRG
ncbi:DNA polymerase III subunit delta [Magnetofaba australis]|uniref:DNA polymerase III subunit delta n=1 Tax=Magnetofaba australis IT-1 TaxID=1434232 RepID=A0A1Y2JZ07_9PROT|nr:DNA polymerase III subunit delta [Magnetofaba australis]OSM00137.1 putative DNA polymerase III subunit delta [Magnetofaba australis IT-1]